MTGSVVPLFPRECPPLDLTPERAAEFEAAVGEFLRLRAAWREAEEAEAARRADLRLVRYLA